MRGSAKQQPDDEGPPTQDEVARQRQLHAHALAVMPHQRHPVAVALSEPDREQYELRLDAYEVQLAAYRAQVAAYAARLEEAHHDGLTGAWLRSPGYELLQKELHRADRTERPLSIAFVDVDGLKTLNDTIGHAAGDRALRIVAHALVTGLRGYDHVIRWGGDEFLCVLPGATDAEAAHRLEQVHKLLASGPDAPTVSVGVVERQPGEPAEPLVCRADRALYEARSRTRRL